MYKSAKNKTRNAKNKTRNARGNRPMNGIYRHLTNNAMARNKSLHIQSNTLINGFNTKVRT